MVVAFQPGLASVLNGESAREYVLDLHDNQTKSSCGKGRFVSGLPSSKGYPGSYRSCAPMAAPKGYVANEAIIRACLKLIESNEMLAANEEELVSVDVRIS
jgi:hypothetical protein